MKAFRTVAATALLLCMVLVLAACGNTAAPAVSAPPEESRTPAVSATPAPAATPEPTTAVQEPASGSDTPEIPLPASSSDLNLAFNPSDVDPELPVNVRVLNGPTGFGMVKLISNAAKHSTMLNYSVTVESDASNITAALISGDADIAALPTNAAAVVYNKTEGGVRAAAEIVRGNLFLLQNTGKESVFSIADLKGKTVYAPAQNPSFILTRLCRQNGLEPGTDVIIDNTYAQPADLRTALAAGEVDLAVLPEPMVTIALSANNQLGIALDLDEVWSQSSDSGIVLGCIVVRTEWAEAHPAELAAFLMEYYDSTLFAASAPEEAGAAIEEAGIFSNGAVAAKALPRCALCFVTGGNMQSEINAYLSALSEVAPQSIGGAVPGDDFYYFG